MKCPVDGAELLMAERHGVEIDYCPKCRGVWLDRGELDKIIEKATPAVELDDPDPYLGEPTPPPPPASDHQGERHSDSRSERHHEPRSEKKWREDRDDTRRYDDKYDKREKYYRKKKRKSILKEIFDVFD
ncbi:zf-TFIIB domain-containing protein [Aliiroseovarius sp. KMU-50]|uniref:Zf-TFIIB domain-containing protein n=1 Tax=Aliiroseovarius salicola TaxID=3009082 RepID=A0ABT4W1A0_9RHOB|nr:zf-TFIIB domain-containing protein [Aliiroseovarius sp. KMU-50]MDA5093602.1 zf-TFIIB domain-containing protein [Aliiroseovarius sp. KMU-50]